MAQSYNNEERVEISKKIILADEGDQSVYYFSKREIDIALSFLALVILFPVMLIIAIMIRLDSEGPIFFVQKRVGAKRIIVDGKYKWENS
jgi:lipopolysaccharide/colanic/teichoic acid biosynthesis glycosyltransferase